MNRYARVFEHLGARGEAAFIPFAVAGDPDLALSERILKTYIDAGADILEIGYPFSDPVADGPVNQRAGLRAIAAGLNHAAFFALIRKLRAYADVPIGVLLYANSAMSIGYGVFCQRAADAGIDSLLVADLPPEESGELRVGMRGTGLGAVYIVSELTPPERIRRIVRGADSFVYVVSRLGPTGTQADLSSSVARTLDRVKKETALPLCVGFGISTPDHVRRVAAAGAHGVIVGSALVAAIESHLDNRESMVRTLKRMVRSYKSATVPHG